MTKVSHSRRRNQRKSTQELSGQRFGDNLMTVGQLAAYLGVAVSTIYGWASMRNKGNGRVLEETGRPPIPVVKVGRLNRFRKEDIDEWLEECAEEA